MGTGNKSGAILQDFALGKLDLNHVLLELIE
ncbi:hypothetical protein HORM4_540014 [Vibrio harveyi]|nr:hypothetical protein TH15OA1_270027 [Vibrio harveyi]CAH1531700.1 hypothetical protein VHARVF571_290018 [Vibrio harveyi]CAH1558140.1 hypothetical protein THOE12_190031 [Vibrio rotiferianus]CAH1567636.1 hypothetical protein THOD03_340028 [Vibrio harveyi]CAK6715011.1 hypothetical protein HORM4_540014 [Vibrio harveyi]